MATNACDLPGATIPSAFWQFALGLWDDPDVDLIPQLISGVRIGANHVLPPSPLWPKQPVDHVPDQPLSMEVGQWSGADEHPSIVTDLLQEEIQEAWVEEIAGGEEELKMKSPHAIGKLNLVLAPNRSQCLVVDSSVSGVTAHTCITNRMCLPRIFDVICAPPDLPSSQQCTLYSLWTLLSPSKNQNPP